VAAKKRRGKKQAPEGRLREIVRSLMMGAPMEEDTAARVRELTGLSMIGLAAWLIISLISYQVGGGAAGANHGGAVGSILAGWAFLGMGLAGYLLGVLGLFWGAILLTHREVSVPLVRVIGTATFILAVSFLLELAFPGERSVDPQLAGLNNQLPYGPGGWFAHESVPVLVERFGQLGLWVLLLTITAIAFTLATEMAFYPAFVALGEWIEERREERGQSVAAAVGSWLKDLGVGLWDFLRGADLEKAPAKKKTTTRAKAKPKAKPKPRKKPEPEPEEDELEEEEEDEYEEEYEDEYEYEEEEEEDPEEDEYEEYEEEDEDEEEYDEYEEEDDGEEVPAPLPRPALKPAAVQQPLFDPPTPPPGPWSFPPLETLVPPSEGGLEGGAFIEKNAHALEQALASFSVSATVVNAQIGPAVTMFELEVTRGTRMNKVTALTSEIAATLKARSVRIIAPIPGKSTIGIEIPNSSRRKVRISELVNQTQKIYDPGHMALPLFLGMDAEGTPIVEDLARMPHLLIAGTTGSGKSVCINTIIASILLTRSPHDAKLILVDPKMVELMMFKDVPHLELPVVTDMRQAANVLNWAVEKMEARYELFSKAGVKNIKGYNALGEERLRERLGDEFNDERTPRHVPYITLIIDEMADLMMQSKKEAEAGITRLAQKSRAVGIHVIVATQRPSTDVITGVIKGNLPTRIAFQVASKIDSRVILDGSGAETLLGQGDMLFSPPNSSQLKRVQGAMIEDDELQAIVDFVTSEAPQAFNQELVQAATGTAPPGEATQGGEKIDELFYEAGKLIIKNKRGSASLLQRAFSIGYTRASRLVDQMTDNGVLGPHTGSKAREVLMTLDDFERTFGIGVSEIDE
jgi:S-DNA-T family DNA segregation ATPase FtsK/SpoIIIE